MKLIKLCSVILLFVLQGYSQENDLLNEVQLEEDSKVESSFKSLKIVNLETTKLAAKGDLYLVVSHRFGYLNDGFENFFGLDNATTQLKIVYGLCDKMTVHFSRSTYEKTYDSGIKYTITTQKKNGFPFAIVGYNAISLNSALKKEEYSKLEFKHRLAYNNQLLISRKFSENLSLELAPTFFYENLVKFDTQDNAQFAIGMGGRYKLSKRFSLNIDYAAHLNRAKESIYKNPLSIGVDLETGGHIFQMFFTNSTAMHDSGYLGNTVGRWDKGDISFGFNMVRVF